MNAALDQNGRNTLIALLNTDGETIKRIRANASNNRLKIDDGNSGNDNGGYVREDEDTRNILWAVSSSDGESIVPLYSTSSGELLIQSI